MALAAETPVGAVYALSQEEQRIDALTDAEFCAELNQRPCNPFVFAAWRTGKRPRIVYDGWSIFKLQQDNNW